MIKTWDRQTLWDTWGIIKELVVCSFCTCSFYGSFQAPTENHQQPFTNDFPRADIHELLAPDLLHQVIKGAFKDHLVTWVGEYLVLTHGEAKANAILADIDVR